MVRFQIGMEDTSGLEAKGSVDQSSASYGVGIERIFRLLIVLMVGLDVDCL